MEKGVEEEELEMEWRLMEWREIDGMGAKGLGSVDETQSLVGATCPRHKGSIPILPSLGLVPAPLLFLYTSSPADWSCVLVYKPRSDIRVLGLIQASLSSLSLHRPQQVRDMASAREGPPLCIRAWSRRRTLPECAVEAPAGSSSPSPS